MVRLMPASLSLNSNNNNNNNNNTSSSPCTPISVQNKEKLSVLARYVPLRLNEQERSLLQVLEQTLHVSEYTDHVDVSLSSRQRGGVKTRRILEGILEVCHIATGLAVASGQEKKLAELCKEENINLPTSTSTSSRFMKKKKKKLKNKNGTSKLTKRKKKNVATSLNLDSINNNHSSWASREPSENEILFQTMFEIGRRNKVLNPASMRTTYGKLMYLLQDAQNPTVARSLGFSLHKELLLVAPYLEEHGLQDLLTDARLECATQYVADRDLLTGQRLDRCLVQAAVSGKQRVTEELVQAYSTRQGNVLSADNIRRAIESLADAVAYIECNERPVQCMLQYLEQNFTPIKAEPGFSLSLSGSSRTTFNSGGFSNNNNKYYGLSAYNNSSSSEGPTLSHSHSTQYTFVWQSLRLWSKVQRHMHKLWICADDDLLSTTSTYHLYNTGQGLNRVQNCPRVRKVMSSLLHQTQTESGNSSISSNSNNDNNPAYYSGSSWVGLSVIHLGDRDVPNALIFIDKYTQIPRFLSPIVSFLQSLPDLTADHRIASYIAQRFESPQQLQKMVLADYFKHGFDGSGDDGGSCIDGRLTSSWNWTSRLAKKKYYNAFMLSGFQGFDGDFR